MSCVLKKAVRRKPPEKVIHRVNLWEGVIAAFQLLELLEITKLDFGIFVQSFNLLFQLSDANHTHKKVEEEKKKEVITKNGLLCMQIFPKKIKDVLKGYWRDLNFAPGSYKAYL